MDSITKIHKIGSDIEVIINVSGDQREFAQIIFSTPEGNMGTIYLEPEIPKVNNLILQTLLYRKIKISNIRMRFPTSFADGNIEIRSEYSNRNGSNFKTFNGLLAAWTLEGN